jgi:hypothetical protein
MDIYFLKYFLLNNFFFVDTFFIMDGERNVCNTTYENRSLTFTTPLCDVSIQLPLTLNTLALKGSRRFKNEKKKLKKHRKKKKIWVNASQHRCVASRSRIT